MSSPQPPRRRLRALARLLLAVAAAGALAAGLLLPFVGGLGLVAGRAAGDFLTTSCDLTITPAAQTSTVYASDGRTVLATLYAQNRQDVGLTDIPKPIQDALIDTEDRRFYSHHGVDLRGLLRAALNDSSGSGDTQGGSTLTMQYVKQVRYYQAQTPAEQAAAIDQTLSRKVRDAKCAIDLEKRYSKDDILDDYFNIAFFGENSYGIQVAAETYFGVPASKLTLPQGATLVGLLQSPSELDPFVNPSGALARRNQVLQNMATAGQLSQAELAVDQATPLRPAGSQPPAERQGCTASSAIRNSGFFCDYAVNWLATTGGLSQRMLQTGGLKIVTSLDASLQDNGQLAVWDSGLDPNSATALVMPSVDPRTGRVTSMITSRRYGIGRGETTLPLFSGAYAGAGSTYKYFTALAALKLGVQPDLTLTTGSRDYTVRNCPTGNGTVPYTVHNAGDYRATLPLSDALPESVNTYFVGLEDQLFGCDLTPVVQTALSLGMTALNSTPPGTTGTIAQQVISQHQSGFTLGFEPTSALQLSAAYAAMANDGVYCPPDPIVSVTGPTGAPVSFHRPSCSRQFSPQVARTLLQVMTADTDSGLGTAGSYFHNWYADGGSPVASKTGTDNDRTDTGNSALWFVGVTPNLVSAAALVDPEDPKATVTGLPANVSNSGSDVFGAYAATYWLDAYGPVLQGQQWSWPAATDVPNPVTVPYLTGRSVSDATADLAGVGLTASVAPTSCGSSQPAGLVAYYGPRTVSAGSAVTLCLSSGNRIDGGGG